MIKLSFKTRVHDALAQHSSVAAGLFDRSFFHPKRDLEPSSTLLINDLNQYWRIQLGSLNIDTVDARSALIDTADFEKWLSLFTQYVQPVVLSSWVAANSRGR